jgi:sec-independent protein translocase protein TatC
MTVPLDRACRLVGPPRLRRRDILDWPAFCSKLNEQGASSAPSVSRRIWRLLPPETQALIKDGVENDTLDRAQKNRVLASLNEILEDRDFYTDEDFRGVTIEAEARELLQTDREAITSDRVRRLNRLLLEAAYPQEIAQSQSIDPRSIRIALKPPSMFLTSAAVSLIAAVALTVPVTLYEMWMFVAPGLKRKERRVIRPVLAFGTFFFVGGAAFAYYVVLPVVLHFLLSYTLKYDVAPRWNIGDVVKFEAILMLVFGIAFEMPLVIVGLTRVGLVSPEALASKRRHVIVLLFVAGALLTPPDVVSQVCLAVPMVILFEISIQASRFFRRKGSRWEEWDKATAAEEQARRPARRTEEEGVQPEAEHSEGEYADGYSEGYYDDEGYYHGEEYGEEGEERDQTWTAEDIEPEPLEEEEPGEGDQEPPQDTDETRDDHWDDDLPPDAIMH